MHRPPGTHAAPYEEHGSLKPAGCCDGGHRLLGEADVQRLHGIQALGRKCQQASAWRVCLALALPACLVWPLRPESDPRQAV